PEPKRASGGSSGTTGVMWAAAVAVAPALAVAVPAAVGVWVAVPVAGGAVLVPVEATVGEIVTVPVVVALTSGVLVAVAVAVAVVRTVPLQPHVWACVRGTPRGARTPASTARPTTPPWPILRARNQLIAADRHRPLYAAGHPGGGPYATLARNGRAHDTLPRA